MNKILYILVIFVLFVPLNAQNKLNHPMKMYRDSIGRLYTNKNQPMYLFLGTNPDKPQEAEKLESERSKKYANPFYFDTEGLNTVRTPSEVDPVTKQLVYPIADVVFEVYADGLAPTSKADFLQSKKFMKDGITYYNSKLKISISATDHTSGIDATYFSIDGGIFQRITDSLSFTDEKEYKLAFYSVDNVGNSEEITQQTFAIDKTPPITNWKINGETSGQAASGRSFIELLASDAISGVKNIKYQIDDNPIKVYSSPIPLSQIATGEHNFKYWVEDNVGNITKINNSSEEDINVYAFIVDDVAPTAAAMVEGDQYMSDKYMYVSSRSKCKLTAEDDQLGINKITYSFNNRTLENTYESPFLFDNTQGPQAVYFQSYDLVSNKSKVETLVVNLDNEAPITGIDFKGPTFFNRDTMFINKTTSIKLPTSDNASGLLKTEYSVDNKPWQEGTSFLIEADGFHEISFSSTDKVNNKEDIKKSELVVDNEGPEIFVNFSIKPIRTMTENGKEINIYPPFVKMYIAATDVQCGTNDIWFSVDNGERKKYSNAGPPSDLQMFKLEKTYTIQIDATDNLGNIQKKEVTFQVAKK